MRPDDFLLGTHIPSWLERSEVPLFVSHNTLEPMLAPLVRGEGERKMPIAIVPFGKDSGGFTKLQLEGGWRMPPETFAVQTATIARRVGKMLWAAPQDWMCEPQVIKGLVVPRKRPTCPRCENQRVDMVTRELLADERPVFVCPVCHHETVGRKPSINVSRWLQWACTAGPVMVDAHAQALALGIDAVVTFHGTGLSVIEHQRRTIDNLIALREIAPGIRWVPVLQGWAVEDYHNHVAQYKARGLDLSKESLVGVGSVCRRQNTKEAEVIFRSLVRDHQLRLHGFGVKQDGLARFGDVLVSADSLAWSYAGRCDAPLPGHDKPGPGRAKGHKNCANCYEYAMLWRERTLAGLRSATRVDVPFGARARRPPRIADEYP